MRKARKVDPDKEKYWRDVFKRFQTTGLPFKKFCADEKISSNTFQYWRAELRRRDQKAGKASEILKGENRPSDLANKFSYWTQIIQDLRAYDGSARGFCKERGISKSSLHYWTTRLKKMRTADESDAQSQPRQPDIFVPLQVVHGRTPRLETSDLLGKHESDQIQITLADGTSLSAPTHLPVDILIKLVNGLR